VNLLRESEKVQKPIVMVAKEQRKLKRFLQKEPRILKG
jgi:hypothetical protein